MVPGANLRRYPGLSTYHSYIATENWDDDFEDSRDSPAKRRPPANRIADEEPEESWDEEHDEELNEFGLANKDEEDRTVTARSPCAALAYASDPLPPLPVPFPLLFTLSSPRHTQPFPRTLSPPGGPRPRGPQQVALILSLSLFCPKQSRHACTRPPPI
ncbi:hypothetical protein D9613_003684 [Agrocybe pediades]|uniref:Uncharacterized protein n=1 Tax=Agrocybe pediades TaxID=84607 RepID=A0A8H4QJ04_9AGAR|nr:hypothetical protein D9613_003684 [Agrocybe pediades]